MAPDPNGNDIFSKYGLIDVDAQLLINPVELRTTIRKIFADVLNFLSIIYSPRIAEIVKDVGEFEAYKNLRPKNARLFTTTDTMHVIEFLMEEYRLLDSVPGINLLNAYIEVVKKIDPVVLDICVNLPVDPVSLTLHPEGLTTFESITSVIINVNILRLLNKPVLVLYNFVYIMSTLSDFIELQKNISKGNVFYSALDTISNLIQSRAFSACKFAIQEFDRLNNLDTFASLPGELKRALEAAPYVDEIEPLSSRYHDVGGIKN